MGEGVSAALCIDKEPSPQLATIEKTQSELRQKVAVREERRRELEFLEKGGNPLDFTFGDTSAVNLCFLPPTDPLAEQNSTSEAKGRFCLTALPNGESAENDEQCASFVGRSSNGGASMLPFAGNIEPVDSEANQRGQASLLDRSPVDLKRRESEDSCGVRVGVKKQAYARRNRPKLTNFNAGSSLRDTEKTGAVDGASKVSAGMKGIAEVKEAEASTIAEKDNNISLISIAKAISLHRTGLPKTSSCKEHMGSDFHELRCEDGFGDKVKIGTKENCSFIKDKVDSEQVRKHAQSTALDVQHVVIPTTSVTSLVANKMDNQSLGIVNNDVDANTSVGNIEKEINKNLNNVYSGRKNGDQKFSLIDSEGFHPTYDNPSPVVGNLSVSDTRSVHKQERNGVKMFDKATISIACQIPVSMNLDTKTELTAPNNTGVGSCRRPNSFMEDKNLGPTDDKVKIQQAISGGEKVTSINDVKGKQVFPLAQDLKVDRRSAGISTLQNGAKRPVGRVSSLSNASSGKFPANNAPWEKEKDKVVEPEKHKADLPAAARKAYEDLILEDAEAKKAVLRRNAELARRRPFMEPPRSKSHWDFVLAEMSWMAEDFMQERLWKMTAAAQVSQWVAQEKGQMDFQVRYVQQKQKSVAHVLSTAVMKFWSSVEILVSREKHVANLKPHSNTSSRKQNPSDSEAVPMEIDPSIVTETHKKDLGVENVGGMKCIPIREYAIRLISYAQEIDGLVQAEASLTTDGEIDAGMLEPLWEDKYPEESLFYSVPCGAMEAYRSSVELNWASLQNQELSTHLIDTDAEVGSEASDGALGLSECGMSSFGDNASGELSSKRRGLYGYEESRMNYLSGSRGTIVGPKKRKNLMNAPVAKNFDTRTLPPVYHQFSVGNNAEKDSVDLLPFVPGKRSSISLKVGVIPTKRVRSSAVAARRTTGMLNSATVAPPGMGSMADVSSGDTTSQQEAFGTADVVSQSQKTEELDSMEICGNNPIYDGTDMSFKLKKKKKSKPFGDVISSITRDIGGILVPSEKGSGSEHMLHKDAVCQHEQREQMKRKGDSNIQICDTSLGSFGAASENHLSNSHGMIGQHATKKPKLSKHLSDTSPEVTTCATNSTLSPGTSQVNNMSKANNKVIGQIICRERGRKNKTLKAVSSHIVIGIPWSTMEDQALLVLAHDVGSNWELVSDIINSSLQIKGIFRKPMDCKERHKYLVERSEHGCYSPEDSVSSQPYPSNLPGIQKGSTRLLLQRLQSPMEEDTLKTHLEKIVQIGKQHCSRKIQNDSQETKKHTKVHSSHDNAISCISLNSSNGEFLTPLDLCHEGPPNAEMLTRAAQLQASPGSSLVTPNILGAASGIQPTSSGITFLQGTKSSVQSGTGLAALYAGPNGAGSTRDLQKYPIRPLSITIDEQQQHLQQYNRMVAGRSLGVSGGVPIMSLSTPNESGVPMAITGNGTVIMSGFGRGMSLSRSGFSGRGATGIPDMVSSGINNMLPSSSMHLTGNTVQRARDIQVMQPGQDQRHTLIQELQIQAQQNNGQVPAPFSTINNAFTNQMVSSANHNFCSQHWYQNPQLTEGHCNQLFTQSHIENHDQSYMQVVSQLQQQQQQHNRYLQSQPQFPSLSPLLSQLPQSRPLPVSHMQHSMQIQPRHLPQDHQQQSVLQQNVIKQESTLQLSPTVQQPALQQCVASSSNPPLLQSPKQQHISLSHMRGQSLQAAAQSKSQCQSQLQKQPQPQPQTKMSKGLIREAILSPNMSAHPGQANVLSSVPGNSNPIHLQEQVMNSVSGQRLFPRTGLLQSGKQLSQPAGKHDHLHGQGSEHEHLNMSHVKTSAYQQQKRFPQQSFSKQTSPVVPQHQIPFVSGMDHQVLVPSPSSVQQLLLADIEQPTSVSVLLPSSQQQQRAFQSQQTIHRKQPQHQLGSTVGSHVSPQLCKNSLWQQNEATSQPENATLQPGSNTCCPSSIVCSSPIAPVLSTLNSSTTTVHSSARKGGQNISHTTGGLYNLSRSTAAATSQTLSAVCPMGTSMSLSNGNAATSTITCTGLDSHEVDIAGISQQQSASPVGPVHEQKGGNLPAISGRMMQQVGANWPSQQPQLHQQQHMPTDAKGSISNCVGGSHSRPSTSGVSIHAPYQGSSSPVMGHLASAPMIMQNNLELRQRHAGISHMQGVTSHIPVSLSIDSIPNMSSPDGVGSVSGTDLEITSVPAIATLSKSLQQ